VDCENTHFGYRVDRSIEPSATTTNGVRTGERDGSVRRIFVSPTSLTMNGSLANLARAQDELRNAVSVGLSEIKSAYETVVKDSETEHKGREQEREQARRAIETAESDKEKLETKLTQCEEALKETKNVLMETREQAKDVRLNRCD